MSALPERIKNERIKRGLNQTELATYLGIKKTTISNYETGYSSPDNENLKKIAQYFGVSTDYLLGLTDDPVYTLTGYVDANFTQIETETRKTYDTKDKINKIESIIKESHLPYSAATAIGDLKTKHDKLSRLIDLKNKYTYIKKALSEEQNAIDEIDRRIIEVPIIGYVPAGAPLVAEENLVGFMPLPFKLIKNSSSDIFCLEVRGDSMIDANINPGDIIVVSAQPIAENGQTVVARTPDGVTVKRFYKLNGTCRLEPANDNYQPIDCRDVEIIGRVIKIIKDIY